MCRGGMARGTGGGVGERRGWLCSKSNGGRRGRSEGLGRVTGRTGESPEREWNQYVEASVCPWPHMRVSVPGEAKHASIYPVGRGEGGGERRRVPRTLLWSNPRGQASMPPLDVWSCTWHPVTRTLLEFLIGVFEAIVGLVKTYFLRKSWFDHWGTSNVIEEPLAWIKKINISDIFQYYAFLLNISCWRIDILDTGIVNINS